MLTISDDDYLKTAQLFNYAIAEHYIVWFTGEGGRHRRTEEMLPRLVKRDKLKCYRWGNRLVYICPRLARKDHDYPTDIEHGLGVTSGLVRFWRSDMTGTIILERFFRGLKSIPEWGIRYASGSLLLYEYCTKDNFYRRLKSKLTAYTKYQVQIEQRFASQVVVVFVCDVSRESVTNFIARHHPTGEPYYFTDYQTFKNVKIGQQLTAPIYLWEDGNAYPLRYVETILSHS